MIDGPETILGIKFTHLVAGVLGGTVRAFLVGGGWSQAFISAFVGAVSSGYFTDPLTHSKLNYLMIPEGTVGFLVGLTSMLLCEGVLRYARMWSKNPIIPKIKP